MSKADGERIANALISDDPEVARAAAKELSKAPPRISNPTAKALARIIKEGGERAAAVSELLRKTQAKWFGGSGYSTLQKTVLLIYADGGARAKAVEGAAFYLNRGPDKKYNQKRIKNRPRASASMFWRVLSVGRSIWVMLFFGMILAMGIMVMLAGLDPLIVIPVLLAIFALFVGIDGWRRKCPRCSMILAGERIAIVANEYGHIKKWRCVGCNHHWQKQWYSTS